MSGSVSASARDRRSRPALRKPAAAETELLPPNAGESVRCRRDAPLARTDRKPACRLRACPRRSRGIRRRPAPLAARASRRTRCRTPFARIRGRPHIPSRRGKARDVSLARGTSLEAQRARPELSAYRGTVVCALLSRRSGGPRRVLATRRARCSPWSARCGEVSGFGGHAVREGGLRPLASADAGGLARRSIERRLVDRLACALEA
jgi:hypothetical protein